MIARTYNYLGMSERMYADKRCSDGVFASGWRNVKEDGRIRCAGGWYQADMLKEIVGEHVHVQMSNYSMQEILIERGIIGCTEHFCKASIESVKTEVDSAEERQMQKALNDIVEMGKGISNIGYMQEDPSGIAERMAEVAGDALSINA